MGRAILLHKIIQVIIKKISGLKLTSIQHSSSFEVVSFWSDTHYLASLILTETFVELRFCSITVQRAHGNVFALLDVSKSCSWLIERGKNHKWWYVESMMVVRPGECRAWQKTAVQAMLRNLSGLAIKPHSTHLPSKQSYKHWKRVGLLLFRVHARESSVSFCAKQFYSASFGFVTLTIYLIILQINIIWRSESLFILEVDYCYSKDFIRNS